MYSEENCFKTTEMINFIEKNCEGCQYLGIDTLYMRLFGGAKKFHSLFCLKEEFKKKMTQYLACFKDLREEFIDCSGEGDWFENSNLSIVCETSTNIAKCNFLRTMEECGENAALLLTCLTKSIFETVLVPTCDFPKLKGFEKFEKSEIAKLVAEDVFPSISNGNPIKLSGSLILMGCFSLLVKSLKLQ